MTRFKVIQEKFFRSEGIHRCEYHPQVGFDIETVGGSTVFLTVEMVEQIYGELLIQKIGKNE